MLMEVKSNINSIKHFIPELTTVMNQTGIYVQENRHRIAEVEEHQEAIDAYLEQVDYEQHSMAARLGRVEIRQTMERVLTALEIVGELYRQKKRVYHTERAALEVGNLTEDLLPSAVLEEILQQAISQRFEVVSQPESYCQTLIIEPI